MPDMRRGGGEFARCMESVHKRRMSKGRSTMLRMHSRNGNQMGRRQLTVAWTAGNSYFRGEIFYGS